MSIGTLRLRHSQKRFATRTWCISSRSCWSLAVSSRSRIARRKRALAYHLCWTKSCIMLVMWGAPCGKPIATASPGAAETWISRSGATLQPRILDRQSQPEARVARSRREGHVPAMLADDAVDSVEAQPGAFAHGLRGEERLEDARLNLGWNALAIVDDLHQHVVAFDHRADLEFALSLHRVGGIVDQVGPHLVQFAAIGRNARQIRIVVADHRDSAFEFVRQHD